MRRLKVGASALVRRAHEAVLDLHLNAMEFELYLAAHPPEYWEHVPQEVDDFARDLDSTLAAFPAGGISPDLFRRTAGVRLPGTAFRGSSYHDVWVKACARTRELVAAAAERQAGNADGVAVAEYGAVLAHLNAVLDAAGPLDFNLGQEFEDAMAAVGYPKGFRIARLLDAVKELCDREHVAPADLAAAAAERFRKPTADAAEAGPDDRPGSAATPDGWKSYCDGKVLVFDDFSIVKARAFPEVLHELPAGGAAQSVVRHMVIQTDRHPEMQFPRSMLNHVARKFSQKSLPLSKHFGVRSGRPLSAWKQLVAKVADADRFVLRLSAEDPRVTPVDPATEEMTRQPRQPRQSGTFSGRSGGRKRRA